jgi:hypothetical protein
MANPWNDICEWVRSQSSNMQDIVQSLSSQNQVSDIGAGDALEVPASFSPVHIFVALLFCVWGFLYIRGQRRGADKGAPGAGGPEGPPDPPAPPAGGRDGLF